jgi:hypothetical protein
VRDLDDNVNDPDDVVVTVAEYVPGGGCSGRWWQRVHRDQDGDLPIQVCDVVSFACFSILEI